MKSAVGGAHGNGGTENLLGPEVGRTFGPVGSVELVAAWPVGGGHKNHALAHGLLSSNPFGVPRNKEAA